MKDFCRLELFGNIKVDSTNADGIPRYRMTRVLLVPESVTIMVGDVEGTKQKRFQVEGIMDDEAMAEAGGHYAFV